MKGSQRLGEFELQLRGIHPLGLGYEQPPFEHLQLQAQLLVGRAKSIALLGQSRDLLSVRHPSSTLRCESIVQRR